MTFSISCPLSKFGTFETVQTTKHNSAYGAFVSEKLFIIMKGDLTTFTMDFMNNIAIVF